jgi:hypothetical protein
MLQLVKEASNLSSLKIDKKTLFVMLNNRKLCEYLNKMIKQLEFTDSDSDTCINLNEIERLCQIFSNMEVFRCNIDLADNLEIILKHLAKLTHMKNFSYRTFNHQAGNCWLKDHKSELDLYSFTIICESRI